MKKSLLAVAFAMVAMASSAQIYVGGSLGINSTTQKFSYDDTSNKSSVSSFSLSPEVGWIMDETLSFGAALNFTTSDGDSQWDIKPYARYTFQKIGNVSCFVDGVLGFGSPEKEWTTFSAAVRPGISANITEHISLISTINLLGWESTSHKEGKAKASISNLGLINNAAIGVYYTF